MKRLTAIVILVLILFLTPLILAKLVVIISNNPYEFLKTFDKVFFSKQRIYLSDGTQSGYFKDKDKQNYYYLYNDGTGNVYRRLNTSSGELIALSDNYAKDDNKVFSYDREIEADAKTFNVIDGKPKFYMDYQENVYKTIPSNKLHYEGHKFGVDKANIYWQDDIVTKNTFNEFEYIAYGLIRADNNLIIGRDNNASIINHPEFDAYSFVPINQYFFADKDDVFCFSQYFKLFYPLPDIDRASFKYYRDMPNSSYSKIYGDGNNFYYFSGDCIKVEL